MSYKEGKPSIRRLTATVGNGKVELLKNVSSGPSKSAVICYSYRLYPYSTVQYGMRVAIDFLFYIVSIESPGYSILYG